MKKLPAFLLIALFISLMANAQDDKAQLSLNISKVYNDNMDQLELCMEENHPFLHEWRCRTYHLCRCFNDS